MASSSSSVFSLAFTPLRLRSHHRHLHLTPVTSPARVRSPLRAYRKTPNYPQDAVVVFPDPRAWIGDHGEGYGGDDDDEEEEEEEEDDRSLDLLARFVENVFTIQKGVSSSSKGGSIGSPTFNLFQIDLSGVYLFGVSSFGIIQIRFSVNGVMILAFLWILKAFLEVVCTVGSMVFVSVILVRGVLSGIFYIKERQHYRHYSNKREEDNSAWSGAQPAT